jgi:hypothetical protein
MYYKLYIIYIRLYEGNDSLVDVVSEKGVIRPRNHRSLPDRDREQASVGSEETKRGGRIADQWIDDRFGG